MSPVQAVLFDLDGTLLHTVPDLAVAVNNMLESLGRDVLSQAQVGQFVGKGAENLVHRSLTGDMNGRAAPDLFEQAMTIWNVEYAKVNGAHATLYPDVLTGLNALKQAGLRLGVVTNKPERFTLPLLARAGLADYFEVVVGGDTCARKKPDPMPILYACTRLGIASENTLMVGDSLNDALAAQAAGVPCWLLPYGYNEGRAIENTPCDAHIENIGQIANRLLNTPVQS